jgi:tRNA threonylcarbamoyladenosine biosynthesis protein TsaE
VRSVTLEELEAWGQALGERLRAPAIIAVSGDLGAGKTTLVKAICRGYGVRGSVTSPTFSLVHEYESSRGPVYHIDLYRLRDEAELTNLGWDDIINSGMLILVEWPEKAGDRMPKHAVKIRLTYDPETDTRRILDVDSTVVEKSCWA